MRHEMKFEISYVEYMILRGRLKAFLQLDKHTVSPEGYFIRSIYFDSYNLNALEEKNSGIMKREKYRIRYYNGNMDKCMLECKIKQGTRIQKESCPITKQQAEDLIAGNVQCEKLLTDDLYRRLCLKIKNEGYKAKVVVDYIREAYVYPLSNLRITFDKELASGCVENFRESKRNIPNIYSDKKMILEVKYDEIIPQHISQILSSVRMVRCAASKYTMCIMNNMERTNI